MGPRTVYSKQMKYLLIAPVLFTFACATSAPRGIRADFLGQYTHSVTLMEVFSTSTFGLDGTERETVTHAVATHTTRWFEDRHVTTISNVDVSRYLRKSGHLEEARDALGTLSLHSAFELQHPAHLRGQEIDLVKNASHPVLTTAPLLFLEIVYYTEGNCRLEASGNHVVRLKSMDTPSCIVVHLQAKLIAQKTAEIMWQNHVLLEDNNLPTPQTRSAHLQSSVDLLFGGEHGLLPLLSTLN